MALDSQQRRIARKIYRVGKRMGANRNQLIAALETGWVESGFRNPTMAESDRDSAGWRQERSHYGPESNRRNVGAAARRFFEETAPYRHLKPGKLSQTVQRSAFPDRYQQSRGEVLPIYAWLKRTEGGVGERVRPGGRAVARSRVEGPVSGPGVAALAAQLKGQSKPTIQTAQLQPPQFSAQVAMPQGYQETPASSVTPAAGPDVDEVLQLIRQAGQANAAGVSAAGEPGAPGAGASGAPGGGPDIRKDGWHGAKSAIEPVRGIAEHFGVPISSEKRSRTYTSSGNVSDHYEGNKWAYALDLDTPGNDTVQQVRLGSRIAKFYSRYGKVKFRMNSYDSGGVVTIDGRRYRVQILGGSQVQHGDHLHVGLKRLT